MSLSEADTQATLRALAGHFVRGGADGLENAHVFQTPEVMRVGGWSHYGQVAAACWRALGRYDAAVSLDALILMPNHLYGIILIADPAADTGADIGRGEEAGGSTRSEGDTILPASSPRLTTPTNP